MYQGMYTIRHTPDIMLYEVDTHLPDLLTRAQRAREVLTVSEYTVSAKLPSWQPASSWRAASGQRPVSARGVKGHRRRKPPVPPVSVSGREERCREHRGERTHSRRVRSVAPQ
jgi:hypothetical protein